jgi:hypothetical protein
MEEHKSGKEDLQNRDGRVFLTGIVLAKFRARRIQGVDKGMEAACNCLICTTAPPYHLAACRKSLSLSLPSWKICITKHEMSKDPVVQYCAPSDALASSVRDAVDDTKEAAQKHLTENKNKNNPVLPVRFPKVAQDMQSLLQEVRESGPCPACCSLPSNQRDATFREYRPLVVILPERLPVPAQVRYTCAVVLYLEGAINTEVVTTEGSRKIEWKDDGTVIVFPGDSTIKSTGDGTLVVYFQNYLNAPSE